MPAAGGAIAFVSGFARRPGKEPRRGANSESVRLFFQFARIGSICWSRSRRIEFRIESPMVTNPKPSEMPPRTVNYRCVCGSELSLVMDQGGCCSTCGKTVAPRILQHSLSLTIAVPSAPFDLAATAQIGSTGLVEVVGESLVGRRYGHFELQAHLGQGGMGQVYRALDTSLQRYVAVKVLRQTAGDSSSPTQSDGLVDKLLQEAVAQARVNHPNIVSIYYVGREQGDPFLAMELVPGQTLARRISHQSLAFDEIATIAIQIAEALRVSYELDIIHGDIKPSNILLQPNGTAKLSDFGMARRVSSGNAGGFGGTPNYLAPELLAGASPSIQSDMYALGVTLYEMTFERLPVQLSGSSLEEWARAHQNRQIEFPTPWPEKFPEGWRTLLLRLLDPRPERRYGTYELLLRDLYRVMPVKSLPARPLPRMIAAAIDYGLVGLAFLILVAFSYLLQSLFLRWLDLGDSTLLARWSGDLPWYLDLARIVANLLFALSGFAAIVLYSLWIGFWRQSLGRALMHLRVFNKYGLRPSGRLLMTRDALRMAIFWVLPLVLFLQSNQLLVSWMTGIVLGGAILFWMINAIYCIFSRKGQALHDRWFETSVVLDTEAGF